MRETWKTFYQNYRNKVAESESELFIQVGRTVGGQPISREEFQRGVQHVVDTLKLEPDDVVFEYCCGNGLVTFEIAPLVKRVIGIDFTDHMVASARRLRQRENVTYHAGDALLPIIPLIGALNPTKYLMSYALAHFEPEGLTTILEHALDASPRGSFTFLATGIPDRDRSQNFYNTPERQARQRHNEETGNMFNDGVGRWWHANELVDVGHQCGLQVSVMPEPDGLANYRMDVLFRRIGSNDS